ncbi:hypothetical protein BC941DRAFT_466989 [Chlamydoabsidia padenii]|nr:hypothetical protein BC941DRAFT_466989 [Chlamydoabsidia padenii]
MLSGNSLQHFLFYSHTHTNTNNLPWLLYTNGWQKWQQGNEDEQSDDKQRHDLYITKKRLFKEDLTCFFLVAGNICLVIGNCMKYGILIRLTHSDLLMVSFIMEYKSREIPGHLPKLQCLQFYLSFFRYYLVALVLKCLVTLSLLLQPRRHCDRTKSITGTGDMKRWSLKQVSIFHGEMMANCDIEWLYLACMDLKKLSLRWLAGKSKRHTNEDRGGVIIIVSD